MHIPDIAYAMSQQAQQARQHRQHQPQSMQSQQPPRQSQYPQSTGRRAGPRTQSAPFSMHTNMASQSQAQSLTSQIRPWFGYKCEKEPGCKCGGLFHDSLILAGLEHQWFDQHNQHDNAVLTTYKGEPISLTNVASTWERCQSSTPFKLRSLHRLS